MAMKCDVCKKGIGYGHNVSHSKRRTRKIFKPNLQSKKVIIDGVLKRIKLCAKCIKMLGKKDKEKKAKSTSDVAPVVSQ
ncbi:50S ribosomal protein L28 [Candidatus Parcubacteria bacterium]|nr:MAG: 50S ribosomal protein L28 [Candidatus Parcubacteria bacterium]